MLLTFAAAACQDPTKKAEAEISKGGKRARPAEESFFLWFPEADLPYETATDPIADVIKDQLWVNPVKYYCGDVDVRPTLPTFCTMQAALLDRFRDFRYPCALAESCPDALFYGVQMLCLSSVVALASCLRQLSWWR